MATTKSHNGLNRGVMDPAISGDAAESEEIRRDIDRTRGEMDRTIDELSERLRPRNLFDDLVDSVRCSILGPSTTSAGQQRMMSDQVGEAASRAGRSLVDAIRENPVPAALMGAGLAWLLFEDKAERAYRRHRIESHARGFTGNRYTDPGTHSGSYVDARTGKPYDASYGAGYADRDFDGEPDVCPPSMKDKITGAASTVKETLGTAAQAVGSATHAVGDAANRAVEGMKNLAGSAGQAASATGRSVRSASHAVGDYGRAAGSSMRGAGSSARDMGRIVTSSVAEFGHTAADRTRMYGRKTGEGLASGYAAGCERFNHALDEKPLAVGVAALAAGLLAGFALPRTRLEDESVGRTSDRLKDEARRRGQEAFDQGKGVVSHLAGTAMSEVEGAGLAPGSLGEKVAKVAKDALGAAKESARREGLDAGTLTDKAKRVGEAVKEKGKEEWKEMTPASLSTGRSDHRPETGIMGASASLGACDLGSTVLAKDVGSGLAGAGMEDMSSVKEDAEIKHGIAEGMSASSKTTTSKEDSGDACRC